MAKQVYDEPIGPAPERRSGMHGAPKQRAAEGDASQSTRLEADFAPTATAADGRTCRDAAMADGDASRDGVSRGLAVPATDIADPTVGELDAEADTIIAAEAGATPAMSGSRAEAWGSEGGDAGTAHIWARKIARVLVLVFCIWLLGVLLAMIVFRVVPPPTSMVILSEQLSGVSVKRQWVPLSEISPALPLAVISSEDGRYCEHWGVDWGAVREMLREVEHGGEWRGASTIPMQTVKNLFLWSSRSYVRKVLEVPLAYLAVLIWGKHRTMEIYLNIVEWGPGIFGAEAASEYHFHKHASQLTSHEAALLAAALPDPEARNPGHPGPITRHIAGVLDRRMPIIAPRTTCVRRPGG